MTRVKHAAASRKRRKKYLKLAKGQRGGRSKLYRTVKETLQKGMMYASRDRRVRKRDFRNLWIARINAACRDNDISYSKFMGLLKKKKVTLDRKTLAELAVNEAAAFAKLVELAKSASK
ncbi:MAG: 50S ribosomal protein L20 [Candidatus Omnitrophica bacterium]|nr:50S ribosomal protein L20 [Candidatus Omnitrophota bacterium]